EISIIGVGRVGGWVNATLDDRLLTRDELERMATMLLGGRAADAILGCGAHAGAASDIDKVNNLLRMAMLELGLYGSLTTVGNTDLRNWRGKGISLAATIGAELAWHFARAAEIVERRRDDIFQLVEILLLERVVTGERLAEIVGSDVPDDTLDGQPQLT